jgi:hypothetical protein
MSKTIVILVLLVVSKVGAQPTAIRGPKCTGIIHGVVYDLSGGRAQGVRVIAFPVGVDLGAFLPTAKADRNGEYLFDHVCHGKYTVMADDPKAGYPSTFPDQNEFLYGSPTRTVRLNIWRRRAEFTVHLPPKPGTLLIHLNASQTDTELQQFHVQLSVNGQHKSPEERLDFDHNDQFEIPVPPGRNVVLDVKAEGYRDISKSIFIASGDRLVLDLSVEPAN